MGGFATLGFVDEYENPLFMKHCLSLFERFAGYITEITYHYPCDESCEVWEKKTANIEALEEILNLCGTNSLASMTIQLDGFYGISTAYACIETITNDCIGLHLSLPWDLFEAKNDLPSTELIVKKELVDIAKIGFRYVYCDHEAYIDHPIKKVIEKKNLYSILVTNTDGDICCYYAPWMIDGLTQRDSR